MIKNNYKNFHVNIYGRRWDIEFVDPKEIEGYNALCYHSLFLIKIRNDFPKRTARLRYTHEIVHAILGSQGRMFQKRYSEEDVCEFISYNIEQIQGLLEAFDNAQK